MEVKRVIEIKEARADISELEKDMINLSWY